MKKTIVYHKTDMPVLVGDYVEYREWLFFWRGWRPGRVGYVPGISPKNRSLEYDGLRFVAVDGDDGTQFGCPSEPHTGELQKSVRFVKRSDDALTETPADYYFGDEDVPPRGHLRSVLSSSEPRLAELIAAAEPLHRTTVIAEACRKVGRELRISAELSQFIEDIIASTDNEDLAKRAAEIADAYDERYLETAARGAEFDNAFAISRLFSAVALMPQAGSAFEAADAVYELLSAVEDQVGLAEWFEERIGGK